MKKNVVFAVMSYAETRRSRSVYYTGPDIYVDLVGLFASEEEAKQHVYAAMEEKLKIYDPDDMTIDRDNFKIEGAGRCFYWGVKECELPTKTVENIIARYAAKN